MKLLFTSSVALLGVLCLTQTLSVDAKIKEETKTLDQLYADAIAEGGNLIWYTGGDLPTQQDRTKNLFLTQFPKINMTVVVDYSKYHDVRLDNQFETDTVVPDVISLQTVQDFPRWAEQGKLLSYKPAGWSKIYDGLKDTKYTSWQAYAIFTFSYLYNTATLNGLAPPTSAKELVDAKWFNQISATYPHDDDAVLFLFTRYAEQYGWDWIEEFAQQNVTFARGSFSPNVALANGEKTIGVGSYGSPIPDNTSAIQYVTGDNEFLAWGQRMAIIKEAKNPAAAKLFLNWAVSQAGQRSINGAGWTIRTDQTPSGGLAQVWNVAKANLDKFPSFMADRASVERWKQTFALYFGEVQGKPTPGSIGLHPGA